MEEPKGDMTDAMVAAVDKKRQPAQEVDFDGYMRNAVVRTVEDTLALRQKLDTQYLSDIAGIRMMEKQMLGDFHTSGMRKDLKEGERAEELEEQRLVTQNAAMEQASGVNAQMGGVNLVEAVTGAIEYLMATGVLKAVSSTESPKTE